jgi:hypothetical protein
VAERIREEPAYMGNTKRGKPADKGEEVQENIKGDINAISEDWMDKQ